MSGHHSTSPIGAFIPPSDIRMLLHNAECAYFQLIGAADLDDDQGIVDERLRAGSEFRTSPDAGFMNYLDLINFMHRRTGLPVLLCVYHVFFLSESAGAIRWGEKLTKEAAANIRAQALDQDFESAVTQAVLDALLNPFGERREFSRTLIDELLGREDERRKARARAMYDAIAARC